MTMVQEAKEAARYIGGKTGHRPLVGLVLGSGLGVLAEEIKRADVIPYGDIPHFPVSTVEGHAGQLVMGELEGQTVVAMQGRFHYYEGYSLEQVTFPIRVMKELGVETLLVTNASGGINLDFVAGDLMLIRDHINFMFDNPLMGPNAPEWGVRFPDMSEAYDPAYRQLALQVADKLDVPLKNGVYTGLTGPTYETPAEIRMFRHLGGDAVGMSTVPEVVAARHGGLRVLGISCITNMAAGILDQPLSHDEVIETAERVKPRFIRLVKGIVKEIRRV